MAVSISWLIFQLPLGICLTLILLGQIGCRPWSSASPDPSSHPATEQEQERHKVPDFIESWETYKNYTNHHRPFPGHANRRATLDVLRSRVPASRVQEDDDPDQTTIFTDGYRLEIDQRGILGHGASGYVYPGILSSLNLRETQNVAIKVSHRPHLLWEAQLMDLIHGDHLLRSLETVTIPQPEDDKAADGLVYAMIMPRMQGNLHSWAAGLSSREEPGQRTRSAMLQMWEGLVQLHAQGFAHRDVKLANMVYRWNETGDMHVLLSDLDHATPAREVRGSAGTLGYLSQEVLLNQRHDPMSSDVFAMAMSFLGLVSSRMSSDRDFRMLVWKSVVDAAKQSKIETTLLEMFANGLSVRQAGLLAKALCEEEGEDDGRWMRRITAKEFLDYPAPANYGCDTHTPQAIRSPLLTFSMDPLSAFSLACNILQVIELGQKTLTLTLNYRKASTGEPREHEDLQGVLQCLISLNVDLHASIPDSTDPDSLTPALARLQQANEECLRLSIEFVDLLNKLKLRTPHALLESIRASIKTLWNRDRMEAMSKAVGRARENLNTALLFYLKDTQATVAGQDQILQSTAQLEDNVLSALEERCALIRADVRQVLEQVQATGMNQAAETQLLVSHRHQLDCLQHQIHGILNRQEHLRNLDEQRRLADTHQLFLASIQFPQMQERAQQIRTAHEKTYRWVLQPQHPSSVVAWLSAPTDTEPIYWISGKPGAGKSTLMRYLDQNLDYEEHMLPWASGFTVIRASYYFWNAGNALQKSFEGLVRSLLAQILEQQPELIARITTLGPKYNPRTWGSSHVEWTQSERMSLLHLCIGALQDRYKILLLIDGLDEYEGTDELRRDVIRSLTGLNGMANVKICLSSRPWNVFRDAFNSTPQLRLEDLTYQDISTYIKTELTKSPRFRYLHLRQKAEADRLILAMTEKAAGVFLWVRLVVRDLLEALQDGDNMAALSRKLNGIPADLDEYFRRMIDSIPPLHRREASKMIQIALHEETAFTALHPLRMLDLLFIDEPVLDFADTSPSNYPILDLADREGLAFMLDSTYRRINSRCMGLLECVFDLEFSDFLDLTTPDYLETYDGHQFNSALCTQVAESAEIGHTFMLTISFIHRSCRDFLRSPEIQELLHQYTGGPFDARRYLVNARIHQLQALMVVGSIRELTFGIASYLACALAVPGWRESAPAIRAAQMLDPVMEALLSASNHDSSMDVGWYIGRLAGKWADEQSCFLTLAIDFDLRGFVRACLGPAQIRNKAGRPILDHVLRPEFCRRRGSLGIGYSLVSPELVRLVLDNGGNPNEYYRGGTVWARFLAWTAGCLVDCLIADAEMIQAHVESIALLLQHGATLVIPHSWLAGSSPSWAKVMTHPDSGLQEGDRFRRQTSPVSASPPTASSVDQPCYAVVDLLEAFRPWFGGEIDRLIALAQRSAAASVLAQGIRTLPLRPRTEHLRPGVESV
ncbi:uncharacterized protein BO66DRAFT_443542 [Aspergillus aculeatinus CBS 121060]|uniref:Uncharacterized protein n=1 Tax=Aspergillus aculeatinus CBS 121060 TaxID=1448322 RepID=A0ACD1GU74_9EURO|nr:hypothetical protein BO66DRAFT_443542 [Aspergillus aculeatinus CBS 121060]RAH64897.1 hypothetical protein BO66DRAFT_443542 [Aspergillus aculeatinus CBS 121060]